MPLPAGIDLYLQGIEKALDRRLEPRAREQLINLKPSNAIGGQSNQLLELRNERVQEDAQTPVPLEKKEAKLLQLFGSNLVDF